MRAWQVVVIALIGILNGCGTRVADAVKVYVEIENGFQQRNPAISQPILRGVFGHARDRVFVEGYLTAEVDGDSTFAGTYSLASLRQYPELVSVRFQGRWEGTVSSPLLIGEAVPFEHDVSTEPNTLTLVLRQDGIMEWRRGRRAAPSY